MRDLRAHPDMGGDGELARRLNLAMEIVRNPAEKASYDEWYNERFEPLRPSKRVRMGRFEEGLVRVEARVEAKGEAKPSPGPHRDDGSLMRAAYMFLKHTRGE